MKKDDDGDDYDDDGDDDVDDAITNLLLLPLLSSKNSIPSLGLSVVTSLA